ncbi:MAG: hypothetical protein ACK5WB_09125 [Phycisphaerales bacterium]|jgi:Zn-finger nucleic acid-binding protein|nr:hypothetical protein [Phycisphaeraceae bacterium]
MGTSSLRCPICDLTLQSDDVNVGTNVAFCKRCSKVHELSRIAGIARVPEVPVSYAYPEQKRLARLVADLDPNSPPAGTWLRDDGEEVVIGATTRSLGGTIAMLFLNLLWNGGVCIFVGAAIAGALVAFNVPIPTWAPLPNPNNVSPPVNTIGSALSLLIFMTPFIAVGLVILACLLMSIAGKEVVRVRGSKATVFVGVGPIGWRRRFDATKVRQIEIVNYGEYGESGGIAWKPAILIDADRAIKFGHMLSEDRMAYIVAALRVVLRT